MKHAVNTESLILAHLVANPGQTPAQIAHAIGRTYITVKSTLKIMLANCDVWNDGYSLHFAVEADGIAEPEYLRLAKLAEELQSRNCWYRAGQAWAQARNSTSRPGLQEKAIYQHQRCMEEGNIRAPKPEPDPLLGRSYSR